MTIGFCYSLILVIAIVIGLGGCFDMICTMHISVVIPAYNEARGIRHILQVLQSCPATNSEIIVVDDGSTDATADIARSFPQVRVISLPANQGKTCAAMKGVEAAIHEHILLMDADLMGLTRTHLHDLCSIYERNIYDMLILNYAGQEKVFTRLIRSFPALSGVRMLKKADFQRVPLQHEDRFRLENRINRFFLSQNLRIGAIDGDTVRTPHKFQKYSSVTGVLLEVPAMIDTLTSDQKNIFEVFNTWNDWQKIYTHQSRTLDPTLVPKRSKFKVSVVIPAYNEEKHLGACLLSLKRQTIPPDEVIVVDNNSTDQTAHIARSYGARLIHESVQGISAARNTGFDAATGDIIARTDADTIVHYDWIERIHLHFGTGTQACTGACYYDIPLIADRHPIYETYQRIERMIYGYWVFVGPCMILHKSVWDQAKGSCDMDDTRVHEDLALSHSVSEICEIRYHRDLIVHPSSRRIMDPQGSFFREYQIKGLRQMINLKIASSRKRVHTQLKNQKKKTREIMHTLHDLNQRSILNQDISVLFEKILAAYPNDKVNVLIEKLLHHLQLTSK